MEHYNGKQWRRCGGGNLGGASWCNEQLLAEDCKCIRVYKIY